MKEKILKAFQARTTILRAIAFTFSLLCCITASAYDVEQDGLYYTLDIAKRTARLDSCSKVKAGNVFVPNQITLKTRNFTVDSIWDAAFKDCKRISTVNIASGVSLGAKVFSGCNALTSIILPSDLKVIPDEAFKDCVNLNEIKLPEGLSSIGVSAFQGCIKLEELNIPESVVSVGSYGFANSGIKNIVLPDNLTYLSSSLFENSKLEHIKLPKNLLDLGYETFRRSCLIDITIPENVTEIQTRTFEDCANLKDVNVNRKCTSISYYAFHNCSAILEIDLPDNISIIGQEAFEGCANLKKMHLPTNLRILDYNAISECPKLDYLLIPDSVTINYNGYSTTLPNTIKEIEVSETNFGSNLSGTYQNLKRLTIAKRDNLIDVVAPNLKYLKILKGADYLRPVSKYGWNWERSLVVDTVVIEDNTVSIGLSNVEFPSVKNLYMGRNIQGNANGKNVKLNCSLDECVGSELESLIIGPLVSQLNLSKADNLKEIHSLITVPLQVEPSFPNNVYINVPLIVPKGTKAAYEQAPGWQNFFDIREEDETTGIESVWIDKHDAIEDGRYNINGQRISVPEKGINIIRYSDGSARKVIVK